MTAATLERDDTALGVRFRDGEPDAMQAVCQRFTGPLFALSRSLLADHNHAHDAVQQTFLQAWRASARFEPDGALSSWLFQICRRVCIDQYRRESRARDAVTATGSLHDHAVDGPSLERTWTVWEVRRAIEDLGPEEREVVRLYHLEGWSHAQIGAALGIPVGTVKSRAFRARRQLADALAHLGTVPCEDRVA
jgi:RNA polymerase sigma-70 factor, ECF subfamily